MKNSSYAALQYIAESLSNRRHSFNSGTFTIIFSRVRLTGTGGFSLVGLSDGYACWALIGLYDWVDKNCASESAVQEVILSRWRICQLCSKWKRRIILVAGKVKEPARPSSFDGKKGLQTPACRGLEHAADLPGLHPLEACRRLAPA